MTTFGYISEWLVFPSFCQKNDKISLLPLFFTMRTWWGSWRRISWIRGVLERPPFFYTPPPSVLFNVSTNLWLQHLLLQVSWSWLHSLHSPVHSDFRVAVSPTVDKSHWFSVYRFLVVRMWVTVPKLFNVSELKLCNILKSRLAITKKIKISIPFIHEFIEKLLSVLKRCV